MLFAQIFINTRTDERGYSSHRTQGTFELATTHSRGSVQLIGLPQVVALLSAPSSRHKNVSSAWKSKQSLINIRSIFSEDRSQNPPTSSDHISRMFRSASPYKMSSSKLILRCVEGVPRNLGKTQEEDEWLGNSYCTKGGGAIWIQQVLWRFSKALIGRKGSYKGFIRLPEALLYLDSPPHPWVQ